MGSIAVPGHRWRILAGIVYIVSAMKSR